MAQVGTIGAYKRRHIAPDPLNRKVAFISDIWRVPARQAIWFARIDAIREGRAKQYRHHPLDESALRLLILNPGARHHG